jgi:inward rectifier potassium channel
MTAAKQTQPRLPPTKAIGLESHPFQDLYHSVLTCSWATYFGGFAVAFLVANALFAVLYTLAPGCIANAQPGSFYDAFFFSVQTMATIGYGAMSPATPFGHVVVTLEALVGMLGVAIVTGLTFAKFSRPTSRVIFSDKVVLAPRNGVPHLMFRMGNARRNMVLEAQLRVILLVEDKSEEGHVLRTPLELRLVRERTALFALSWTAMHKVDETSPFYGADAMDKLRAQKAEIYLSLIGLDETLAQQIHARFHYDLSDIVTGVRFEDVLVIAEDGTRLLDYRKFHDVVPLGKP